MVQKRRWTIKEINILKHHYPTHSSKDISKYLDRTAKAIRNKALKLNIKILKRYYGYPIPIKSFDASSNLSYLIGAIKGDGYLYRSRNSTYIIALVVKDFEFVYAVRESIGYITKKFPKISKRIQKHTMFSAKSELFRTELSNKSLFMLLNKKLENLKPYIEIYPTDFLKGFFDAEGSAWIACNNEPTVKYSNTDENLILYVKKLLVSLGIVPSPKIIKECWVYIKGIKILRPKPLYSIYIHRKKSVRKFMQIIGSSIPRKRLAC